MNVEVRVNGDCQEALRLISGAATDVKQRLSSSAEAYTVSGISCVNISFWHGPEVPDRLHKLKMFIPEIHTGQLDLLLLVMLVDFNRSYIHNIHKEELNFICSAFLNWVKENNGEQGVFNLERQNKIYQHKQGLYTYVHLGRLYMPMASEASET